MGRVAARGGVVFGRRAGAIALGLSLMLCSLSAVAQRGGGGHGGTMTGSGVSPIGRPDGVDEKDDLKTFHAALELQATSDQAAAFQQIVKNTQAVSEELGALGKEKDAAKVAAGAAGLKESIGGVRTQTTNFLNALTAKQKTGLKETVARLEKAGTELSEQEKALDGAGSAEARAGSATGGLWAEGVGKALENFRGQQDRLAMEMGIVLSETEVAFRVPAVKTSVEVGGQAIGIVSSAMISKTGAENGESLYKVEETSDLSDLGTNLMAVAQADLDSGERCGERFTVRDATVMPAEAPSALVVVEIYGERWVCTRMLGSVTSSELAQANGSAEVKVTPVVGADGGLEVKTELGRVEAGGFLGDSLRTGDLGVRLREKTAAWLVKAMASADFRTTLPGVAAGGARAKAARFESGGVGNLSLIVDGELRLTEEQAELLAKQLKERGGSPAMAQGTRAAPATGSQAQSAAGKAQ